MVRRLVPSLATEMHLTVRLLHVHSNVVRASLPGMLASDCHREQFSTMSSVALNPAVAGMGEKCAGGESRLEACTEDPFEAKTVFKTGLDCRSFAASVLLGLKSLLPHIGTDALDLLAGSLALASEVSCSPPLALRVLMYVWWYMLFFTRAVCKYALQLSTLFSCSKKS